MKALFLILALVFSAFPAIAQEMNPRIKVKYDRFSDITTCVLRVNLRGGGIVDLGGGSIYVAPQEEAGNIELLVIAQVDGKRLETGKPRTSLGVTARSLDWRYLSGAPFQVIVNESTRMNLGAMKREHAEVVTGGRGVIEQLLLDVPFASMEKLSAGHTVEIRIGDDEFTLTPAQIADLKDWVGRFPAAQKVSPSARP